LWWRVGFQVVGRPGAKRRLAIIFGEIVVERDERHRKRREALASQGCVMKRCTGLMAFRQKQIPQRCANAMIFTAASLAWFVV
jgi:hypothetical protein